jgi:hypothetical protein
MLIHNYGILYFPWLLGYPSKGTLVFQCIHVERSEENVIWNNTQSFSDMDRSEEHVICNGKHSTPESPRDLFYSNRLTLTRVKNTSPSFNVWWHTTLKILFYYTLSFLLCLFQRWKKKHRNILLRQIGLLKF